MTEDLDSILDGANESKAGSEKAKMADPEQAKQTEEAKGEEAKSKEDEAKKDAPPVSKEPESTTVPITALLDEREKRQEAERRQRELEARFQQQQAPQRPDPKEDPDGAAAFDRDQIEQQLVNQRVDTSYEIASATIPDFGDVMGADGEKWQAAVAKDPSLYERAVQQPSPAKWAYDQMKAQTVAAEVGDPKDFRAKIREEVKAEILAEIEAKKGQTENGETSRSDLPETLAGEQNAGKRGSTFTGPTPIGELLPE